MTADNIKVCCRIRPVSNREKEGVLGVRRCVEVDPVNNGLQVATKPEAKNFTFDFVADDYVDQVTMFKTVGAPITEACVEGYNGTIIAYGQTGSGKTHTMFGPGILEPGTDKGGEYFLDHRTMTPF